MQITFQELVDVAKRPSGGQTRQTASEQWNRELSQKRALAAAHRRRINSLRFNDARSFTPSVTAQDGNVSPQKLFHCVVVNRYSTYVEIISPNLDESLMLEEV
jgi:hypothetical protein